MRVLRGRGEDPEADAAITGDLLEWSAEARERGLRVWRPHRQVAFGRRDARESGYREARERAIERGFPPVERRVGGRAVAYTGTTAAFALTVPVEGIRGGVEERYREVSMAIQRALWRLGVPAQRGEPEGAFCPGNHSLQWGGKLAGIAQRVRREVALVGGVVVVCDHRPIADVLEAVYGALGVAFDPDAVGSVERAGGRADPEAVAEEIEAALLGDREADVERV